MLGVMSLLGTEARAQSGPIKTVEPLDNGLLRVTFFAGGVVDVPVKDYMFHARLCPLKEQNVFSSASTDGSFVRWYRDGIMVVDLSWEEVVQMAVGTEWI